MRFDLHAWVPASGPGQSEMLWGRGKWGSKGNWRASFSWQGCPVEIWPEDASVDSKECSGASSGGFGDSPRSQHLQQCPSADSALTQRAETPLWVTTTTTTCFPLSSPNRICPVCAYFSPGKSDIRPQLEWHAYLVRVFSSSNLAQ